jgi:hydroxyethylthiazole kinase
VSFEDRIGTALESLRSTSPLVHSVTNYVVMNSTANALLALGAAPVMAHAVEEIDEMVELAGATVINIGTLSEPWVTSMQSAAAAASRTGTPWVLDPVGVGATRLRSDACMRILRAGRPSVIRGNASEILALATESGSTRGVDSVDTSDAARQPAQELARRQETVVSVSGATDVVTEGTREALVRNGDALLARVTGTGCMASAITGAFLAVTDDAFDAAAFAMAALGVAGEIAAEGAEGPGSFQMRLFDALAGMTPEELARRAELRS